ncbi:MAG: MFS transporter [Erythrobacter sp.]|uniref:MFS transporter n=1 Tax=Erythrobacter sp. TaxID=1042 RepID=UPI002626CBDA|nr:MFS transporter [Erythrobacter sp.]MDJ0978158.1 MFS transporter [Erythrobacter sp.]
MADTSNSADAGRAKGARALKTEWVMVGVGFLSLLFTFSASASVLPLLYSPMIDEFGWTRTEATVAFTYGNFVSMALSLLVIGPLIDRIGARTVVIGAVALTGVAMVSFLAISGWWSYALLATLNHGTATVVLIGLKVLVSRWFTGNQGFALGIMIAGTGVGGVILPLTVQPLIAELGWRAAYASLTLGIWLIVLPLLLFVAREEPSEGELAEQIGNAKAAPDVLAFLNKPFSAREAVRTRTFWFVAISLYLAAAVDMGVLQHTALFLERDKGLGAEAAALGVAGTFALSIFSKIAAGWFYDKTSLKGISLNYLLVGIAAVMALGVTGAATVTAFIMVRGIAHGGIIADSPVLAKHVYGHRAMNRVLPILTGMTTAGFATGPLALAAIHDETGSYALGFMMFGAAGAIAAAMLWPVRPTYRELLRKHAADIDGLKQAVQTRTTSD